jgi:hypothetical protein
MTTCFPQSKKKRSLFFKFFSLSREERRGEVEEIFGKNGELAHKKNEWLWLKKAPFKIFGALLTNY